MRIFLSHSSRDKALLRELRGHLPHWVSTWIDGDELLIGVDLGSTLKRTIDEQVDYVVLFVGQEALESAWVKQEIRWALDREKELGRVFLLPVLLENIRDRLKELGLAERVTLDIADFSSAGTKVLADRISNHLGGWLSETLKREPEKAAFAGRDRNDLGEAVSEALNSIPKQWRDDIESILVHPFLEGISMGQIGQIPLTSSQYYQQILAEMGRAGSKWEILAVSTLTSKLWSGDLDQTVYSEQNLEAVKRGAIIRRVFVVREGKEAEFVPTVEVQTKSGIEVRVARNSLFSHVADLEDFVLFVSPESRRGFIAHAAIDGSQRIRSGRLVLSPHGTLRLKAMFSEVWDLALPGERLLQRTRQGISALGDPPGIGMEVHWLKKPVISCEEAAKARGISLENELKTLILRTHEGVVAAHLPGDGVLSLRKIKDNLETAEAYLVDPEDLHDLGLSSGTVSAVLNPVWSMPHLVSRRLLNLREVMTNNGTRTGYFVFEPGLLMEAADVVVGDFEK